MAKDGDPVVVYAGGVVDSDIVKSMLDAMDVPAYLQDEAAGRFGRYGVAIGGVKIVVARRDSEAAQRIVDQFIKTRT